ncbi:unnamed protein product [Rotaria sordida]|uniref:ABC transporter domain-containing protein n=1 Tax=Rotaria sordida TaxID=392033 RepID=A0A814EEG8_9BILA|nr:unnamed protein product [Rotaria sordida]
MFDDANYIFIFFENESTDLAVCVENAWKTYGHWWKSITVLHGINVNVPTGIIYGLLGPSGCGKTTLLRCIVGRLELNQGEIIVFGKRPEFCDRVSSSHIYYEKILTTAASQL